MNDILPASGPVQTLVYPAISHAELGRLLQKYGYDAEAIAEEGRIGYRTLSQPRFTAWMQTPFKPRPDEFAAIFLCERFHLPAGLSAAAVHAVRGKTMFAHVEVRHRGGIAVNHTLIVSGGITEYYLRDQLWHWKNDLEMVRNEIRKQARHVLGQTVH